MRYLAVLLLLVLLGFACEASAIDDPPLGPPGEPFFQLVEGTDALANGVVSALAQDQRGLIWMGTPEGLWSWDGYRLEDYRHQPERADSLADDYVRALLPTPDGGLWVATQRPVLSWRAPDSDHFTRIEIAAPRLADDQSALAPVSMALGADGSLWVGTAEGGLLRRTPGSSRFQTTGMPAGAPGQLSHATVRALLKDRRGDLWIGSGAGLDRLSAAQQLADNPRFEAITGTTGALSSLKGQYVYALYEASDGLLWVGTQAHGAAVVDPVSARLRQRWPAATTAAPAGLSHAWVDGFAEPSPGRLWISTFGGGIDVLAPDAGVVQRLRHDPAIPGTLALDRVIAPLKDRSGLLWIGTWGAGLQWHNPQNARAFVVLRHSPSRPGNGLGSAAVMGMAQRADGSLWVGSGGHGLTVLDAQGGRLALHGADSQRRGALHDGTVRALIEDARGTLWVGTQAGLQRRDSDTFVDAGVRLPDQRIRRLGLTRSGRVLVGTQRGLVSFDPSDPTGSAIEHVRDSDGQALAAPIWTVLEDRAQRLWVATPEALYLGVGTDATRLRRLPETGAGRVAPPVSDLREDVHGRLWVLAASGLYGLEEASGNLPRFVPWYSREGVRVPRACGRELRADRLGRLWTPRCRIDPAKGELLSFGRADGVEIGNVELGASAQLSDGRLLFGGTRGLLLIDPAAFRPWSYQPPLLFTSVSIDGQPLPATARLQGVELPNGQSRLAVEFAALDYTAPQHLSYLYRLSGLETGWNLSPGDSRLASYSRLWPGDYLLEVRALNRLGKGTSAAVALPVRVLPAWWQQPLVLLAAPVLLVTGLVAAVRWRTARIATRARRLQEQVEVRTAELNQARLNAEGALADLQRAQGQLVAAEKMAALGQLVAGVAHEINTPVGIAVTAASHLQDLAVRQAGQLEQGQLSRKDLKEWQRSSAEAARLIVQSLERASTLVKSFKQVAVDQSSEQRREFELGTFLEEVRNALTPGFRRSLHRLVIECPPDLMLDSFPGALFQILANLVNNAILHGFGDALERPGEMCIVVKTAHPQRVQITFSDNGAGMRPEVLARACDPFFTTRRGSGGSGLGLHLVHNLTTQLLGGHITLDSTPGRGTTVLLDLPRAAP